MEVSDKTCGTCDHYRQHYAKIGAKGNVYNPLNSGHCIYPRPRLRWEKSAACARYTEKQPGRRNRQT